MIVTTSTRGQEKLEDFAQKVAEQLMLPYIKRKRHSVADLIQKYQVELMVLVTTEGVKCIYKDHLQDPLFFHPNSAMFRLKRLLKGEHDPFSEMTQLGSGMSFLDCTLGLASDSIIASYAVGQRGKVVGVESIPLLAYIVRLGLQSWQSNLAELDAAMRRIKVVQENHYDYLKQCSSSSFDVIYFDPMFETSKEDSVALSPLKKIADYHRLESMIIEEARRVARKRIVMKESSYSTRFKELGFKPKERKYASHWFGTIELE
jgi:hypothetical protein